MEIHDKLKFSHETIRGLYANGNVWMLFPVTRVTVYRLGDIL